MKIVTCFFSCTYIDYPSFYQCNTHCPKLKLNDKKTKPVPIPLLRGARSKKKCFSVEKASSTHEKWNWNWLGFLSFIFSLGQCE